MYEPDVEGTKKWARELHDGQFDKAGRPYIEHVLRVHERLLALFPDASRPAQLAALLHDAIEDCEVTADDLRDRGYSQETVTIVKAVTKPSHDAQSYAERIKHLAKTGPLGALQVKIADLSDNSDPVRLAQLPAAQAASLEHRYSRAIDVLKAALSAK